MKRALTLFRFALLLSPPVTQAALMSGNCNGTPNATVTCDSATGLEWLDLTQTTNQSPNQILAGFGNFIDTFRYATHAEVDTVFFSAGWDGIDFQSGSFHTSPANVAAGLVLDSLLGITFTGSGPSRHGGQGFALQSNGLWAQPFWQIEFDTNPNPNDQIGCSAIATNSFCFDLAGTAAASSHGHFLVRQTPEPSTLALLGVGYARRKLK